MQVDERDAGAVVAHACLQFAGVGGRVGDELISAVPQVVKVGANQAGSGECGHPGAAVEVAMAKRLAVWACEEQSRTLAELVEVLAQVRHDQIGQADDAPAGFAVSRINDAMRPGEKFVVTSRSEQYLEAIRPENGAQVNLRGTAAIQLRPLDANAVRAYLCEDAAGPAAKARWEPVFAVLATKVPAGQALKTPLMVGLARAIYNPRPREEIGGLRDPAELCNSALTDRKAVESLLFDAFIPARYRPNPPRRWTAREAEGWLEFIARHLEYTIGATDFAWWELPQALSIVRLLSRVSAFAAALRMRTGWERSTSSSTSICSIGSPPGHQD